MVPAVHRRRVFALTWLSYASYYLTRQNFAASKKDIEVSVGVSRDTLGYIDSGYLTTYMVGQFIWGAVADRIGSRRVLAAGMLATAGLSVVFGLSSTGLAFFLIFALNGLAQSTGWCANLKAMTQSFPPGSRGAIMGFWSTCYQAGGIAARPIAGALAVATILGWRLAFFAPAVWVAGVGVAVFLFLPDPVPTGGDATERAAFQAEVEHERRRVLRTPVVWVMGASYFFMKLIRYALQLWLPYFMKDQLGYSTGLANTCSVAFEAGGLCGAIAIGYVSDRFFGGRRLGLGFVALVLLAVAAQIYGYAAPLGVLPNVLSLAAVGFFLFGPDTLLSATAAQDIGGPAAAATAGGVINGLGAIGPIVGSALTSPLVGLLGWTGFFQAMGGTAVIAAGLLVPFLRHKAHR